MRSLSFQECSTISGGMNDVQFMTGVAAAVGGTIAYNVASLFSPLSTVIGTVGTAVTLGVVCTPVFPVVGTVLCGSAGAVAGYFLSSTFASVGAFGLGAVAAGFAAYSQLQ